MAGIISTICVQFYGIWPVGTESINVCGRCPVVCLCVQGHQGMSQVTHLDGQVAAILEVGFGFGKGRTVMSTSQQELFCGGHLKILDNRHELVVRNRITSCLETGPYKKSCIVSEDEGRVLFISPSDRVQG